MKNIKDSNMVTVIIKQFLKFGLVGLLNTVISYFSFVFLVYLGVYYIVANCVAYIIGVLNSFYLNRKFVFTNSDSIWWVVLIKMFIAYASTGLILKNILLFFFIEYMHFSVYLSPLILLFVTVPLNFLINKYWSFNKNGKKEN